MRRVVVKARIVRLKLGSKGADAHLRYLQRDGTDREGEKGRLYGAETDAADGRSFLEQAREDRHQFRFIVAPEDGDQLSDLRAFTRDVMKQMEADLGTKLDWVAVDHFNTGHPHSHVVIRGKDDAGKDLIIAQDYITDGVRLRAQELATLELGPETDLELRSKLTAEIAAERFTRIDRAMLAEGSEGILDLRPESGQVRADFDRTLRIGRLQTLARYGLATESEPGVWKLSDELEPTLRELGERGDIVKAINRALKARGEARAADYDAQRRGRVTLRVLSSLDLEAQIDAKGATWLDREMTSSNRAPVVRAGFGAEVDRAMKQRRGTLVEMGHARRTPDKVTRVPRDLVARLERQEIERVGKSMAAGKHGPFKMKAEGERVSGVFSGTTNLVSGKYAVIENAYEFTLVPWRPVMDERLGRQISGVVRDSGISWDFTRTRGIGIGM
jgi:type IV secretory pathway VirD2 relaxase